MRLNHFLFLLLINIAWGFNIVPTKLALNHLPPITAAALRFSMVGLLCLPWVRWVPGRMLAILRAGLVSGALMFAFNNTAFAIATNVSALAIAGQLGVPFSLILAIIFLGERIHIKRMLGIFLSFAGVILLSFDPVAFRDHKALALATVGAFTYASGTILMRQLRGVGALNIQGWLGCVSVGPLFLLAHIMEPDALAHLPQVPWQAFGYVFMSALFSSILGHAGLTFLLQRYPVTVISPLTLLAPLLSVGFSVLLLHNVLTPKMVLGGLITLTGVGIITLRNAQTKPLEVPADIP